MLQSIGHPCAPRTGAKYSKFTGCITCPRQRKWALAAGVLTPFPAERTLIPLGVSVDGSRYAYAGQPTPGAVHALRMMSHAHSQSGERNGRSNCHLP